MTIFLFLLSQVFAKGNTEISLTITDFPFNLSNGSVSYPSMQQSLDLTYAIQRTTIFGIHQGAHALFQDARVSKGAGLAVAGSSSLFLFLTAGWMHEEWHRAVMTNQNISSRNGFYHPEAWSNGLISVDSVNDDDLGRLKTQTPAETVRLMSAGIEGQIMLVGHQSDQLFLQDVTDKDDKKRIYSHLSFMAPLMIFNQINTLSYLNICLIDDSDEITDLQNQRTIAMENRDFAGLDCNAWVYDMQRPDEPYEDRGPHPYGEGIDRYRSLEDLSSSEIELLKEARHMHMLNLFNPHFFGINGLHHTKGRWNFRLGSMLTPFGYTIDGHFGLVNNKLDSLWLLRLHRSQIGYSPEFGVRLFDLPINENMNWHLATSVWLQPKNLRWDAQRRQLGGNIWSQFNWKVKDQTSLWVQMNGKTTGWMAGEVYLDSNISARFGLSYYL